MTNCIPSAIACVNGRLPKGYNVITDNIIDLVEWIIPVNDPGKSAREQQEAQPHPVSEISSAEEPQTSTSVGLADSGESISEGESILFIRISTRPVSSRRTRHFHRENLGQLALDFGDGGRINENRQPAIE
jgi:hypothetical protein